MSGKMKIALVQMKGKTSNNDNMAIALTKIAEAAENGADFVVLPEMFSCPYETPKFPVYAQKDGGENYTALSEAAAKHNIYLVAGSMPEEDNGRIYNTSYVFDRCGKLIGKHRKMHLFDCDIPEVNFFESDTLSAGNQVTTFETEYGIFGLMICFDIRFPELSRLMVDKGAKFIVVPAAFNMTSGPAWWEIMFRARATDNQVYMFGCSPARDEKASYTAWGHSIVVDPFGKILAQLDEKEATLYYEVDVNSVDDFRNRNKILKLRRKDIYTITC